MKINANTYGFSTQNTGKENSDILNRLLNEYNDIEIIEKGEYKFFFPAGRNATVEECKDCCKAAEEECEEEAEEICEADGKDEVIWEAADLLYFVSVLMYKEGVNWQDVYNELDRRHKEKE